MHARRLVSIVLCLSLAFPGVALADSVHVEDALSVVSGQGYSGDQTVTVQQLADDMSVDTDMVLGYLAAVRGWAISNGHSSLTDAQVANLIRGAWQYSDSGFGPPADLFRSISSSATTDSLGRYVDVGRVIASMGFSSPSSSMGIVESWPNASYPGWESGVGNNVALPSSLPPLLVTTFPAMYDVIYSYNDTGISSAPSLSGALLCDSYWRSFSAPLKSKVMSTNNSPYLGTASNQSISYYMTERQFKCVICNKVWSISGPTAFFWYTSDTSAGRLHPWVYGKTSFSSKLKPCIDHIIDSHPQVINQAVPGQDLPASTDGVIPKFILLAPAAYDMPTVARLGDATLCTVPAQLPQGLDGVDDSKDVNSDAISTDFLGSFRTLRMKLNTIFPFSMIALWNRQLSDLRTSWGEGGGVPE